MGRRFRGAMGRGALAVVAVACAPASTSDTSCVAATPTNVEASGSAKSAQGVFANNCALGGCHLGASPAANLPLAFNSTDAMQTLLSARSSENPSMKLIAPSDPSSSWLVRKIDGDFCGIDCTGSTGCGARMPFAPLKPSDRDAIVAWVAKGASSD